MKQPFYERETGDISIREKEGRLGGGPPSEFEKLKKWLIKHKKWSLSALAMIFLCLTAWGLLSPAPPKGDSPVKVETSDLNRTEFSQASTQTNQLNNTDGQVASDDPSASHNPNSQEPEKKSEKSKPPKETISIAPPPVNPTTAEPTSPPNLSWTLTFRNVDQNQGDSVRISFVDSDRKSITVSPIKKEQRWEFRIPAHISTVKVNWTTEGKSGWTLLAKRDDDNTYDFQEFVQMLL